MSYRNVEDSLISTLAAIPGMDGAVDRRVTMINEGHGSALVCNYNSLQRKDFAFSGEAQYDWLIDVELYIRWLDEDQVHLDRETLRSAVVRQIGANHTLGGTANILDAVPLRARAIQQLVTLGSDKFYKEIISVLASEIDEYTEVDTGGVTA